MARPRDDPMLYDARMVEPGQKLSSRPVILSREERTPQGEI